MKPFTIIVVSVAAGSFPQYAVEIDAVDVRHAITRFVGEFQEGDFYFIPAGDTMFAVPVDKVKHIQAVPR